jgi:hypothetical protein
VQRLILQWVVPRNVIFTVLRLDTHRRHAEETGA